MSREDWAESHGYQRGRCPRCRRTVWSDTPVFECSCGWNNIPPDDPEEQQEEVEENA